LGFLEEVWGIRLAQPRLKSWTEDNPLRLLEKAKNKADTDPKALCCYCLLRAYIDQVLLRFVDGRPVSQGLCRIVEDNSLLSSTRGLFLA
jgi:hypothetical protein